MIKDKYAKRCKYCDMKFTDTDYMKDNIIAVLTKDNFGVYDYYHKNCYRYVKKQLANAKLKKEG